MNKIISNCPLCDEHSLHVIGEEEETQMMQCINCGYVSSSKFIGDKKNKEYKKLTDDMKKWSIKKNDRIWIPTIMTLPVGMLYPINITVPNDKEDKVMKWAFAPMVEITEEEKEKYPNPDGGFYERRIDTDNPIIYDKFVNGMVFVNEKMKNISVDGK